VTILASLLALPLLAVVLLVGSYEGLREWAKRNADQLQITIMQAPQGLGSSQVIYQHTFGRSLAAFAENTLNHDMTGYEGGAPISTVLYGNYPSWEYYLTFRWHGFPVEVTGADSDGLPEYYTITALGTTDTRMAVSGSSQNMYSFIKLLSAQSGGAIPLAPSLLAST
jgi:hypothetical protein